MESKLNDYEALTLAIIEVKLEEGYAVSEVDGASNNVSLEGIERDDAI